MAGPVVARSVRWSSLGFERTLEGDTGPVTERCTTARDQPAAVIEWSTAGAATALTLEWRIPDGCAVEPSAGGLQLRAPDAAAAIVFDGADAAIEVTRESGAPAARVRLVVSADRPARVRVAASVQGPDAACAALARVRNASALVRARRAHERRAAEEGLSIEAADPVVSLALRCAATRIDGSFVDHPGGGGFITGHGIAPPTTDAVDAAWCALASLALGDAASVARAEATLRAIATSEPTAAALHILLAARTFARTGETTLVASLRERLEQSIERLRRRDAAHVRALRAVALRELEAAARSLQENEWARLLGAEAALLGGAIPLSALAAERGDGWRAWAAFADGHIDAALDAWRQLRDGLERDQRGAWTGSTRGTRYSDHAASAAGVVLALAEGVLGVSVDAPAQRITLRPTLPDGWPWLGARGIRMGDACIDVHLERTTEDRRSCHNMAIVQREGAVPVTAILEPRLVGSALLSATIDGQPAELSPGRWRDRVVAPIQVVLDHARTIEWVTREAPIR